MLDLKYIISNKNEVIKKLSTRNFNIAIIEEIFEDAQKRNELIHNLETLQAKRNKLVNKLELIKETSKIARNYYNKLLKLKNKSKKLMKKPTHW